MDVVRLAIVGCGTISQLVVPGYLSHPRCRITAVCDPVRERAEQRTKQWDINPKVYTRYEDVLNDDEVDAVELLTPTHLHFEQTMAGLEAGFHVSCQKPVSTTVAEADKIVEAAGRAKTKFRVLENYLFYPPLLKAGELLKAGQIGDPSMVRIRSVRGGTVLAPTDYPIDPEAYAWRRDPSLNPGGQLYDDGWHKFATAMLWLGDVEKVYAMVGTTKDFILEAPSAVLWKMKRESCLASFDFSYAEHMPVQTRYYPQDESFEIHGSRGVIWVTRGAGEMLDMPPVMLMKGAETTSFAVPSDWREGFDGSARNFIDCIVADEQPDMDAEFARRVLQATLAVYEASRLDRPVDPGSIE